MKRLKFLYPASLVLASVVFAYLFINESAETELSNLENILFQLIVMGLGITGSFLIGKHFEKGAAKPHARSAFRRLVSLYYSLGRAAKEIAEYQRDTERYSAEEVLLRLEVILVEQMATADDALEDWYDIVPENVEELREELRNRSGR